LARRASEEALHDALTKVEALKERLEAENVSLRQDLQLLHGHPQILGQSAALRNVLALVEQVAPTNATVFLLGETGTGKELIASAVHDLSTRRDRPMVRVNCAAIPSALIESELFGREKGAYTGALTKQVGRFETANGSSLFLDEIGELPPEVQVKLLRVLQEKQIERLGSSTPIAVDVRIIAATNVNLEKAVHEGRLRQDLYYRLNVFPITVPPLRDRPEDIPLLVRAFADQLSKAMGKTITTIPQSNLDALQRYPWPGNVRELHNVIERAVILAHGPKLAVEVPNLHSARAAKSLALEDVERAHILHVLQQTGWRVQGKGGAAELLMLNRSTLESRMAKMGIRRPNP
jgi:formate hydrogenlyase transcriptional activator